MLFSLVGSAVLALFCASKQNRRPFFIYVKGALLARVVCSLELPNAGQQICEGGMSVKGQSARCHGCRAQCSTLKPASGGNQPLQY